MRNDKIANRHSVLLLLLSILSIFWLNSCDNKSEKSQFIYNNTACFKRISDIFTIIDIQKAKALSYKEFSEDFMNEVHFVQLSSKELIGNITTLLVFRNKIYILDRFIAKKVFIFNMDGELIRVIDSLGEGPEEYLELGNMAIDEGQKELLISDARSSKFLHYTLDGNFSRITKSVPNVCYYPAGNDFLYTKLAYKQMKSLSGVDYALLFSKDTTVLKVNFPYYPIQQGTPSGNPFYKNTLGELLYLPDVCDTVYQILHDTSFRVKYVVNQEKSLWKKRNEYLSAQEQASLIINNTYTSLGNIFIENEFFCYFSINTSYQGRIISRPYFYNKKKKVVFYFDLDKNFDTNTPFKKGIYMIANPQSLYGDYFVASFDPTHVSTKNKQYNPAYRMILENANENTNPALMFYKFNPNYE